MLTISENTLKKEAKERGYRPEILEKVYRLLNLLEVIMAVPYLKERLVLKGGNFCQVIFARHAFRAFFRLIFARHAFRAFFSIKFIAFNLIKIPP